ncbi:efflux RND transporter periplasmic adaptor subunit [Duganella sp. CT11-25]|uniref:efflux RND transporter periplasmic adaptor subunit n=1 Tax=Duganella sp. CT11-25 TaxID=3243027 RepID=UPI0039B0F78B
MSDGAPVNPLLILIELAQRARAAASANELAFLAVNDSRALAPYRQAALWLGADGVHTLSGVVAVEANAPYAQWLDQLCRALAAGHTAGTPLAVDAAQLPPAVAAAWDEWLPKAVTWLPLNALHGAPDGTQGAADPAGLLLAGDLPLSPEQQALLGEWMDVWQHAWRAAHPPARWSLARLPSRLRAWWSGGAKEDQRRRRLRRRLAVGLAVLAVLLFPVRLTVLAPGELVPANPATIRAPLDGVIADFAVRPNQLVAAGQPLFSFDQAPIGSRLDVAREGLSTAQAEYRQAAQMMLNDPRAKGQLAALLGKMAEKQAQATFLEGQAQRSRVLAPHAGIALFDDPSEWIGRPVQTGERIMQVAAADDVEIEAWVPIGDAIPLAEQAPLHLYLAASPLTPLTGTLRYMSHRAAPRPDGSYAYRVRARLDAVAGQRIGLKGTAKLAGERVPLIYWILRRPLASIRQFIAL